MKELRMLGTAALAVTVLMALGGSAAATTLCKENLNKCPEGQEYPVKETILAGLEAGTTWTYSAIAAGGGVEFSGFCKESSISWSTTENTGIGKTLMGTVTSLLYGQCKNGMTPCEKVIAQNLPYGAEMIPLINQNASGFWINGTGVRKLKFEKCGPFAVNCVYEPTGMQVIFTGGNPATIFLVTWEFKSEGGNPFCGEKIKIGGKYTVAAPKPVWVSDEP